MTELMSENTELDSELSPSQNPPLEGLQPKYMATLAVHSANPQVIRQGWPEISRVNQLSTARAIAPVNIDQGEN